MKIGIIADIHANLTAWEAVWPKLKKCKIILNAGDLTGYYADVNESVNFLRRNQKQIISILGNHDRYLLKGKLPPGTNLLAQKPLALSCQKITSANLKFLKKLNDQELLEIEGLKIGLFHGSPTNPDEYIYPDTPIGQFKNSSFDYIILGHTHWPMTRKVGQTIIINPGSVGQSRDKNRKASYAILNTRERKIEIKRVEYNIEAVCRKIEKLGFDERLAQILRKENE